ncbi:uncharacterized protein [Penaeus vannamei]|uniref:uncharacterized protein n=1 Tax=Penaeus vannamei TaxID=6689 RepID=UPI00387F82D6
MPQGFSKKKKGPEVPAAHKKGKRQQPLKAKRGIRTIAPKKTKAVEAKLVQKQLQKAINANIEQEMQQRASKAPQNFKLLKKVKPEEGAEKK